MTLEPVLGELFDYFVPLATQSRMLAGAPSLSTPQTNILGLNATYLDSLDQLGAVQSFIGWPRLVASTEIVSGQEVGAVRVGTFAAQDMDGPIVVEQVSRLQLSLWSAVLAEAHGTLEWAGAIAEHLALVLEGDRRYLLLMAYAGSETVGALLHDTKAGAAHLWGTLDEAVDRPLLNASAQLAGGSVRVSLPDSSPVVLTDESVVVYTLLKHGTV